MRRVDRERRSACTEMRRAPQPDMSVPQAIRTEVWTNTRARLEEQIPVFNAPYYGGDIRDRWIRDMTVARTGRLLGDPRWYVTAALRRARHTRLDIAESLRQRRARGTRS
jgi:hypothetical protein